MSLITPRSQFIYSFTREERQCIQAVLNHMGYPGEDGASLNDQTFWRVIQDSLRQDSASYLVDATTAVRELALRFPLSLVPRDTNLLSERVRITRSHHLEAFQSLFADKNSQQRVTDWLIEIFSHIHTELALTVPWVLLDERILVQWLGLMRAERLSEDIRVVERLGENYHVTLLRYDMQQNGWQESKALQSHPEVSRLANDPSTFTHTFGTRQVILRRMRGPVDHAATFAEELLKHIPPSGRENLTPQGRGFTAIQPLMEHAVESHNAHELFSVMVEYLPSTCHLTRAAIFLYLPLLQAFKGIYAYHLDESQVRRVIEGKSRFLELLESGRRGAAVIAATDVIAANYVKEFRLKDVLVLPIYVHDDVEAILLMDRDGDAFQCSDDQLHQIEVISGWMERLLRRHMESMPHAPVRRVAMLTPRELDILHCIGQGLQTKSIAQRLNLSPLTVRDHTSHIMAKLQTTNRTELVVQAYRLGLLDESESDAGLRHPPTS